MYAIIQNGCQQYKVTEGDSIKVDLISSPEGSAVQFDNVLMAFFLFRFRFAVHLFV